MPLATAEQTTRLVDSITSLSLDLFKRYGYRKTTVADIASGLRISKKTLYEIFSSKEEILMEAMWRDIKRAIALFDQSLNVNTRCGELLMAFCRHIFVDRVKHGKKGHFWGLHENDIHIQNATKAALRRVFYSIYQDGAEKGEFKPLNASIASDVILNMLITVLDRFQEWQDPMEMFHQTQKMIADAVANTSRISVDRKA